MSISGNGGVCNCDPTRTMKELSEFVSAAVRGGVGMRDFERELFDRLLAVGFALTMFGDTQNRLSQLAPSTSDWGSVQSDIPRCCRSSR